MENLLPRAPIAACMTCPLCKDLFEEATTISLCLHTFCKKCIHDKFSDEESDTCPVCDVYLGTTPEDKLRPDNNLQALREEIFPTKRIGETSEFAPSGTPPSDRKDKSTLISLASKKQSSSSLYWPPKADKLDKKEDVVKANKTMSRKKLAQQSFDAHIYCVCKTSKGSFNESSNEEEAASDCVLGKGELWEPLKYLSEVAKGSDTLKLSFSRGISESCYAGDDDDDDNDNDDIKAESERNLYSDQQVVVDVLRLDRANMEEAARLPQLSSRFLRLKNGEMPVSYIQKYIANKFQLTKEDEVVIKFQGEALLPSTLRTSGVHRGSSRQRWEALPRNM